MIAPTEEQILDEMIKGISRQGIALSPGGIEMLKALAKQEKTYLDAMAQYNFQAFAPARVSDFLKDQPESKVKEALLNFLDSGCSHEWVDVGFSYSKMVCKKCNKDKS